MIKPLFNLNYFLIGMYFGLINYSLQKGIGVCTEENYELPELNQSNNNDNNNEIILNSKTIDHFYLNKDKNLLKSKPFLKSTQAIIIWHKDKLNENNENNLGNVEIFKNKNEEQKFHIKKKKSFFNIQFIIFMIILILIILFLSFLNPIFIYYYDAQIEKKPIIKDEYSEADKLNEKFLLEGFLSSPLLNFIFLIDIEIYVFLIHWIFFLLYMKSPKFLRFFTQTFWFFFTKCYFSFAILCNSVIVCLFYQTETVVKINILNIYLFYLIDIVIIFIATIFIYIFLDLPLKKLFKYIINCRKTDRDIFDDKQNQLLF